MLISWQAVNAILSSVSMIMLAGILVRCCLTVVRRTTGEAEDACNGVWWLLPLPVLIWVWCAGTTACSTVIPSVLICSAIWLGGWGLLRVADNRVGVEPATRVMLMAIWTLWGAAGAITATLSPDFRHRNFVDIHNIFGIVFLVATVGGVLIRRRSDLSLHLFGTAGAVTTLVCFLLVAVATTIRQLEYHAWIPALVGALLAGAIQFSRAALGPVPATLTQWLSAHRYAIFATIFPAALLFVDLHRLFPSLVRGSDLGPACMLVLLLLILLWAAGQRVMAVIVAGIAGSLVLIALYLHMPAKLVERWAAVSHPEFAVSSQPLFAEQAWGQRMGFRHRTRTLRHPYRRCLCLRVGQTDAAPSSANGADRCDLRHDR